MKVQTKEYRIKANDLVKDQCRASFHIDRVWNVDDYTSNLKKRGNRFAKRHIKGRLMQWDSVPFRQKEEEWVFIYNPQTEEFAKKKEFDELVLNWREDTDGYSTSFHKSINQNYLQIIAMGKPALPLILKELKREPNHWFIALKTISKQNPVLPEHMGNIKKMREDWLNWGEKNKLI